MRTELFFDRETQEERKQEVRAAFAARDVAIAR
jgi:hypothetical protein